MRDVNPNSPAGCVVREPPKTKFFARRYAPILVLVRVREPLLINQFPSRVRLREGVIPNSPAGCVVR